MALQSTVSLYPALGMAGQQVVFGQADYTEVNYISDGTAKAGQFAFVGSASVNTNGADVPVASLTNSSATRVLGLVEKVGTGSLAVGTDGSMVYGAGELMSIAKNGEYYVESTGACSVGDHVLVNKTTGAMSYATPSSASVTMGGTASGTVTGTAEEGVVTGTASVPATGLTATYSGGVTITEGCIDTGWIVKSSASASGAIIIIASHANA